MGKPGAAEAEIEEYRKFRLGAGWCRGTPVQVLVGGTFVVTRVEKIVLPIVHVIWGHGTIPRNISNVLPLLPFEQIDNVPAGWKIE